MYLACHGEVCTLDTQMLAPQAVFFAPPSSEGGCKWQLSRALVIPTLHPQVQVPGKKFLSKNDSHVRVILTFRGGSH